MLKQDKVRLDAVIEFAENVLTHGRDCYRKNPTPLFADGINVDTGEHVKWNMPGECEVVISDMGNHQNLFRTLATLSELTSEPKYKEAAKASIKYHFDNLLDESGLLKWGGHKFIDLKSLEAKDFSGGVHELKNCLPYYDLMYEVNPDATARYIKSFWNAHIYDWEDLYVGRHGKYGLEMGSVWEHSLVNRPPYRESPGLSFINCGNDLIYSAATLYKLNGDKDALKWAKHLAKQYVLARNPETGLGAYQFTQPKKTEDTDDDNITLSFYGDRAKRQMGPEFKDKALEAKLLFSKHAKSIYVDNALMQLQLSSEIGAAAEDVLRWTHSGLQNFKNHAYIPEINCFKQMFTDGTDLTGYTLKRNGYYGKAGNEFKLYNADLEFLLSYTRAFLATGDEEMWEMARNIARGNGLGDLGSTPGKDINLNLNTEISDYVALFAVLDLYKATSLEEYLNLGRVLGNNILTSYFHKGYFTQGPDFVNARFDAIEPLALLTLQAAIDGQDEKVPSYIGGSGFLHGYYVSPDGSESRIKDFELYTLKRGEELNFLSPLYSML